MGTSWGHGGGSLAQGKGVTWGAGSTTAGAMLPVRPSATVTTDGVSGLQDQHPAAGLARTALASQPRPSPPPPHPVRALGCWGGAWAGGGRGVGPRRALTPSRLLFPALWLRRGPWGPGSVCDGWDGVGPESILSYCRFLPELQIPVSHPPPPAPPQGHCRGSARPLTPGPPRAGAFAARMLPFGSPAQGLPAASRGHRGSQQGVHPCLPPTGAADPASAPFFQLATRL